MIVEIKNVGITNFDFSSRFRRVILLKTLGGILLGSYHCVSEVKMLKNLPFKMCQTVFLLMIEN